MRPAVFFRLRLRLSLQNTAELPNPDSLTNPGTKTGGLSSPGAGLDNFDRTFLRELSCQSFLIVVPFEKPVQQRQDHFESIASPEVRDDLLFDFAILANRANDADILVDSAIGRRNFDRSNEYVIIITILNPIVNTYIR